MMKYIPAIAVLLLFACSDHDDMHTENAAVAKACKVCHTDPADMLWLRDIIRENNGNVYAINTSDGVYFIHQPVHMSCMACVRYRCSGTQPASVSPAVQEEIQNGIKKSNLIYEVKF